MQKQKNELFLPYLCKPSGNKAFHFARSAKDLIYKITHTKLMNKKIILAVALSAAMQAHARDTYNFNSGWIINGTKHVTLPRAWNEDEAYKVPIYEMSDSVVWYRKHFKLPRRARGQRVIIEFEGARQAAEIWLNGKKVGLNENGIMAFGFDLTPYVNFEGDNFMEVRTDNDWRYKERRTGSMFQWNDKNFNCNYGGLPKNIRLHIVPQVHQTLPLYSSLGTTGQYIYATDYNIRKKTATINVETQVENATGADRKVRYSVVISDYGGKVLTRIYGGTVVIPAQGKKILKVSRKVSGLNFWSWGYGFLYRVKTIVDDDAVETITGFRKTQFTDGIFRLNDRAMMVHGFAQRSSNEWPGVGMSVPAWLSDYSNKMFVDGGGNVVRWMHITPWKQDVESCDRMGLIEAMPAGDSEKDVDDRRWEQRKEVMRDAIIYNRNNPSVIFIESGNKGISKQHMLEMKAIRDEFDPMGGRAIGCREMLDIPEAEYGGEMLYVNKSDSHPMWMMEYCRDEALRKYWNAWTYPFHAEGAGPRYRNGSAVSYNHNQDEFSAELVRRWYDYWQERPGQGTMCNDGGVKIVFSDTQTHGRSEENYRLSGVVDPMRIAKDGYYAQQAMWDGWVDDLKPHTYIVGHWSYADEEYRLHGQGRKGQKFFVPTVYVVSTSDSVALFVNDKPLDVAYKRDSHFLFTFKNLPFTAGTLTAIGYSKEGREESRYSIETAGKPCKIKLTAIENPTGWRADGADVALVQVEIVDKNGRRCPTDDRMIEFSLSGAAEWRGGVAHGRSDNYVLKTALPVECGVNRVMLRSLTEAGNVVLKAKAEGMDDAEISLHTVAFAEKDGLAPVLPSDGMPLNLSRGATPLTPSYKQHFADVEIISVEAGSNASTAQNTIDKNENSYWQTSGKDGENWITYTLREPTIVSEISIKSRSFRDTRYPIAVYVDGKEVFRGFTTINLGYSRLKLKPVKARQITIKSIGASQQGGEFSEITEMDSRNNDKKIKAGNHRLQIVELQLLRKL